MPDNETTTTQTKGYFTGILDMYVAKMLTPDTSAAAPTYDTPRLLGMSIEVTITPQFKEGALHASNKVVRSKKVIDRYDLSFNADVITPDVAAYIYDRKSDAKGVQILDGDNNPPECAIGFARTKDNGEKEYWWLYRTKFSEPTVSGKTEADAIEYQTPTIEARCDRRIYDNKLGMVADSEDANLDSSVLATWFSAVYEAAAAASSGSGTSGSGTSGNG